ncbi:MAG: hypothetical protein JXB48_00970, partial [Candidatus Latescibacteria bacterium]|nr:hypothetical protein [Candidatus Latescibacterota bacterium]
MKNSCVIILIITLLIASQASATEFSPTKLTISGREFISEALSNGVLENPIEIPVTVSGTDA